MLVENIFLSKEKIKEDLYQLCDREKGQDDIFDFFMKCCINFYSDYQRNMENLLSDKFHPKFQSLYIRFNNLCTISNNKTKYKFNYTNSKMDKKGNFSISIIFRFDINQLENFLIHFSNIHINSLFKDKVSNYLVEHIKKIHEIYLKTISETLLFLQSLGDIFLPLKNAGFDLADLFNKQELYSKYDFIDILEKNKDYILLSTDFNIQNKLDELQK